VVFYYNQGPAWEKPTHHIFKTKEAAEEWANGYRKGVYSLEDGTLSKIDIRPVGAERSAATSAAQRNWAKNAAAAAQNLATDKDLAAALSQAAKGSKYLSEADLRTIVSIESSANRQTGKNKYGYAGLFQMGPAAAKDAGYKFEKLDDPSEWRTNVAAGVRYLELNAQRLSKAGVDVTPLNLYIAHQQGAAGGVKTLREVQDGSASETPANRNQLNNLPSKLKQAITESGRKVTVQDYYDYWSAAFQTVSQRVNQPSPPSSGSSSTPMN
jgi:hypothetical protein